MMHWTVSRVKVNAARATVCRRKTRPARQSFRISYRVKKNCSRARVAEAAQRPVVAERGRDVAELALDHRGPPDRAEAPLTLIAANTTVS